MNLKITYGRSHWSCSIKCFSEFSVIEILQKYTKRFIFSKVAASRTTSAIADLLNICVGVADWEAIFSYSFLHIMKSKLWCLFLLYGNQVLEKISVVWFPYLWYTRCLNLKKAVVFWKMHLLKRGWNPAFLWLLIS